MFSLLTVIILVFSSTFSTLPLNACSFLAAGGVCACTATATKSAQVSAAMRAAIRRCIMAPLLFRGGCADLDQQRARAVLRHVDDDTIADLDVREMTGFAGGLEFCLGADRQRLGGLVRELDGDRLRRHLRDRAAHVVVAVVRQRAGADREDEGDDRKQLFHVPYFSL